MATTLILGKRGPQVLERERESGRERERHTHRETDRERQTERLELIKVADEFVEFASFLYLTTSFTTITNQF